MIVRPAYFAGTKRFRRDLTLGAAFRQGRAARRRPSLSSTTPHVGVAFAREANMSSFHSNENVRVATLACAVSVALVSTSALAIAAETHRDPIEGAWLGMAGTDKEKVEIGLELYHDASGKLRLKLTEPIINTFGYDDPNEVKCDGKRIVEDSLHLDLTLK